MAVTAAKILSTVTPSPSPAIPRADHLAVHMDAAHMDYPRRMGLEALCDLLGARTSFDCSRTPDIYYGAEAQLGHRAAVWISPEPWPMPSPARISVIDGCPIVHHGSRPESLVRHNRIGFDIALAAHHWLSLKCEDGLARDEHGRVRGAEHPVNSYSAENPPLHQYADLLLKRLGTTGWVPEIPRWPENKTYAVAFTHDVDDPERDFNVLRLFRKMAASHRNPRQAYWFAREHLGWIALRERLLAAPERRREWDFDTFVEAECRNSIRSAFYFGSMPTPQAHPLDVRYDIAAQRYRNLSTMLAQSGCEIGLHAAYDTANSRPSLAEQVESFGVKCGHRPGGVRYHYLQLDASDPMGTLHETANAGLSYDTTVGFNDQPGFRAGIAAPFLPPCRLNSPEPAFVELPMTLADMHLPRRDEERATNVVLDHLDLVKSLGGLAVLNWHVGHWHSDPAWREAYVRACAYVSSDPDVWLATPSEIADWWIRRRSSRQC
jgi:hypothetical protein